MLNVKILVVFLNDVKNEHLHQILKMKYLMEMKNNKKKKNNKEKLKNLKMK